MKFEILVKHIQKIEVEAPTEEQALELVEKSLLAQNPRELFELAPVTEIKEA